jgi:hypothetical protein
MSQTNNKTTDKRNEAKVKYERVQV